MLPGKLVGKASKVWVRRNHQLADKNEFEVLTELIPTTTFESSWCTHQNDKKAAAENTGAGQALHEVRV